MSAVIATSRPARRNALEAARVGWVSGEPAGLSKVHPRRRREALVRNEIWRIERRSGSGPCCIRPRARNCLSAQGWHLEGPEGRRSRPRFRAGVDGPGDREGPGRARSLASRPWLLQGELWTYRRGTGTAAPRIPQRQGPVALRAQCGFELEDPPLLHSPASRERTARVVAGTPGSSSRQASIGAALSPA